MSDPSPGGRSRRAATLLGPNTKPILGHLVAHLCGLGHDVALIDGKGLSGLGEDAADAVGQLDLIWACGLLTTELIMAGCQIDIVAAPTFAGESGPIYRSVLVARPEIVETLGNPNGRSGLTSSADRQSAKLRTTMRSRPRFGAERLPAGPLGLDDILQLRVAVNETGSWSGYHGLIHEFTGRGASAAAAIEAVKAGMVLTGAHVESMAAVAEGRADLAAIDHSIWQWMARTEPASTADLIVVDETGDWPAPPFSIGGSQPDRAQLAADLLAAPAAPEAGLRAMTTATVETYRFMTDRG